MKRIILKVTQLNKLNKFRFHRRLSVFVEYGTNCNNPSCDRVGTKLMQWQDKTKNIHWDVFTKKGTLMTVDHVIPKSKGGTNDLKNKQILCCKCNSEKSDKLIPVRSER